MKVEFPYCLNNKAKFSKSLVSDLQKYDIESQNQLQNSLLIHQSRRKESHPLAEVTISIKPQP